MSRITEAELLQKLRELHAQVDRTAAGIVERLPRSLKCGPGCASCCQDDLTVFAVEALRIRREFPDVLKGGVPGPVGRCAFLDGEDRCRVYSARPYVCRTQGLPLRWLVEQDGEWVEYRDICPINDDDFPLVELPESDCYPLGPAEEVLRELQFLLGGDDLTRVALRSLISEATGR
ncbi:MAG: YkgJ family cysteine cluster protein [Candidatus Lernaella stagnicola]|nr:YkgJ family cysteine cluster protein [Candidatus Lernaella stagnicola]